MFVWAILFATILAFILIFHPVRSLQAHAAQNERDNQTRAAQRQFEEEVAAFIAEIDIRIRVFGLDPNLSEITELKAEASRIVADRFPHVNYYLRMLNPYEHVECYGGRLTIHERMFGHILQASSLAEFHLQRYSNLAESIQRITVDGTGTHVFGRWGELVHYEAGVLNPHRLADPGNRVENAIEFAKHFTGLELDWQDFWPLYWAEFKKDENGIWLVECGWEPATASK